MKVRHLCAVLGVAIAVGAVVFMQSLVATNDRQSTAVAARLLEAVPVGADAKVSRMALDFRPEGRVMQGPPLMAAVASQAAGFAAGLKKDECVVTKALFAQRRLDAPAVGSQLTLVGRKGAYRVRVAAIVDWDRPVRGYPNMFVSPETASSVDERWEPWKPLSVEEIAPGFRSDAGRNFDRAKALLLWAAALTALCLLVNSLFLSVEARRRELAILRMLGMTRRRVALQVVGESLALAAVGTAVGVVAAIGCLWAYVACDRATFPLGPSVSAANVAVCVALTPVIAAVASLVALKPALSVRPIEAMTGRSPRRRGVGMLIAFACGFGAFVAVEVWGASLMCAFVPSPEWPDAIVSILPGGVSSFDIAKLQGRVKGVSRIHELAPLQVNLEPLEELPAMGPREPGMRGKQYRNALLLGSDWLPDFTFVAGDRATAEKALREGDNCIVTDMMARARRLKLGDALSLDAGRGLKVALKIVGIVDLNWHMVTSRGLVRGLNRMPINTDGPVFVSFDTVEACDARPATMVRMTHLWLDFEPAFLAEHGVFESGRIVEREIVEALGLIKTEVDANTVRLHSRDEVADGTLAHGVDLIGSMARVPFVFIAVISLGFIALLVAAADSRKRELVVLRTVGATRGQVARVLAGEALRIAAAGVVLGLVGGALVGWLCTAGTRAAMANWGIPPSFALPALTLAKGAAGAIGFALAVAIPTALCIIRGDRRTNRFISTKGDL